MSANSSQPAFVRRRRLVAISLLSIVAIVGVGAGCGDDDDDGGDSGGTTDVTLRLDWVAQGYQAPFYAALGKGYYEEEGQTSRSRTAAAPARRSSSSPTAPMTSASVS